MGALRRTAPAAGKCGPQIAGDARHVSRLPPARDPERGRAGGRALDAHPAPRPRPGAAAANASPRPRRGGVAAGCTPWSGAGSRHAQTITSGVPVLGEPKRHRNALGAAHLPPCGTFQEAKRSRRVQTRAQTPDPQRPGGSASRIPAPGGGCRARGARRWW